jgi:preprotein translocase subunit SecF
MYLPIIKHRAIWFVLSSLLVIGCIVALAKYPLKFGIDFTGGSLMEVAFEQRPDVAALRATLSEEEYGEVLVQTSGDDGVLVRMKHMDESAHQAVLADLVAAYPDAHELRFESVGPTVGEELRRNAVWSLSAVLIAIALYIAYAFRRVSRPVASWKYGLITLIVGLLHDVLLPLGVFAVLGHTHGVELNSGFVAAILTILGFSVHDTIVVFDRIRENLLKTGGSFEEIVERSVNETLARSINTSLTTMFPLIAIWFWGGESLRYFALALLIGIVVGAYSSIFLASPLLVVFQKKNAR